MTWTEGDERRETLTPIRIVKLCEVCGADMKATGVALTSSPPQYPHLCSADPSHSPKMFAMAYPHVSFDRCCEGGPYWGHASSCERAS